MDYSSQNAMGLSSDLRCHYNDLLNSTLTVLCSTRFEVIDLQSVRKANFPFL